MHSFFPDLRLSCIYGLNWLFAVLVEIFLSGTTIPYSGSNYVEMFFMDMFLLEVGFLDSSMFGWIERHGVYSNWCWACLQLASSSSSIWDYWIFLSIGRLTYGNSGVLSMSPYSTPTYPKLWLFFKCSTFMLIEELRLGLSFLSYRLTFCIFTFLIWENIWLFLLDS